MLRCVRTGVGFGALCVCGVVVLSAWVATRAGDPAANDRVQSVQIPLELAAPTVKLSEISPGHLADFVRSFDKDRFVSFLTAGLVGGGLAPETWAAQVTVRLGLSDYDAVESPVALMLGKADGSRKQPIAIAGTDVQLSNGEIIHQGGLVPTARAGCVRGAVCESVDVTRGLIVNGESEPITMKDGAGTERIVESGGSLFVGTVDEATAYTLQVQDGQGGVAGSCTAQCNSGYYACCNYSSNNTNPSCKCKSNGTNANCDAGGEGASSCALAQ